MANKAKGEVGLTVDGEKYTLRFSINAMCEAEDLFDGPFIKIVERLSDPENVKMGTLRKLLLCGLMDYHPELSLRDAGEIGSRLGMIGLIDKLSDAIQIAFPEGDEDSGKTKASKT